MWFQKDQNKYGYQTLPILGIKQNPMYLALVTDAYSKQIMGHDLSASLDVSGSLRALKMALKKESTRIKL
jgi:hypothetical protein